jgi:hypothetical protein
MKRMAAKIYFKPFCPIPIKQRLQKIHDNDSAYLRKRIEKLLEKTRTKKIKSAFLK